MERNETENEQERTRRLRWCGVLLKKKRVEKGWSQESVCTGICAVSTLSKIESGTATGSEEILELLAARLELSGLPAAEEKRAEEVQILRMLEQGENEKALHRMDELEKKRKEEGRLPDLTWILLLGLLQQDMDWQNLEDAIPLMNQTERILYALLNREYETAAALRPKAWVLLYCMSGMYRDRQPESQVLEMGLRAYEKAAEEGELLLMGLISTYQAMVCSNLFDLPSAFRFMERAQKIFTRLQTWKLLNEVNYNLACTWMTVGEFEKAIASFEQMGSLDTFMPLLKLAICYEQTGNPSRAVLLLEQARAAQADGWSEKMKSAMIGLCAYRLEHEDWLHDPHYGKLLMNLFDQLTHSEEGHLHKGFAQFYLPWVIQWLKSSRQYARLSEILESFSKISLFTPV